MGILKNKYAWYAVGISVIYICFLLFAGVGIYNDSDQYINMHIRREPLYPMFLWFCRLLAGDYSLQLAIVIQSVLGIVLTNYFVVYISKTFALGVWSDMVVIMCTMLVHFLTPLYSSTNLVLSTAILSESICIPLFLLFAVSCHKMLLGNRGQIVVAGGIALILSLVRSQMMVAIVIWMVLLSIKAIVEKKWRILIAVVIATALLFGARTTMVKVYNQVVHGYYINNTYSGVFLLTNLLYASNPDQVDEIEDEELRMLYGKMSNLLLEKDLSYQSAPEGFFAQGNYLEVCCDAIKFEVIEPILREYTTAQGEETYIDQDIANDALSMQLIKELLPHAFLRWLGNYCVLIMNGIVRSLAVLHPVFYGYAVMIMLGVIYFIIKGFQSEQTRKSAYLLGIGWLCIMGLTSATSVTFMCISRYMVYSFPIIYVGIYVTAVEWFRRKKYHGI